MTSSQLSTSDQLRDARLRIAALERELAVLRATTNPPKTTHTQQDDTNSSLRLHKQQPDCTDAAYSDVSRDQSQSQLSVSCLDDVQQSQQSKQTPESSPVSSSPLKPASAVPLSNTSPILSDAPPPTATSSPPPNHSSQHTPSAKSKFSLKTEKIIISATNNDSNNRQQKQQPISSNPSTPPASSSSSPTVSTLSSKPQHIQHLQQQRIQSKPIAPSPTSTTTTKPTQSSPLLPATTTAVIAPNPSTSSSQQQRVNKNNQQKQQHQSNNSTNTTSNSNGNSRISTMTNTTSKRKSTSLSMAKTSSSTKKDRTTLVAKCVEPRPGQTRYWTEEEHQRFLEAIAEYGDKAYVAISNYVETRTPKQVRTHAQKFQMKMARLARQSLEAGQPIQMPPGMCPVIEVPMGSKSTIVPITPEQTAKLCSGSGATGTIDPTTIVSTLSSCQSAVRQGYSKKRGGNTISGGISKSSTKSSQRSKQTHSQKLDRRSSSNERTSVKKEEKVIKSVTRIIMEDEVKGIKEEDVVMDDAGENENENESASNSNSNRRSSSKDSVGSDESCSSLSDPCDEYITCAEATDANNVDEMELETKLKQTLDGATSDGDSDDVNGVVGDSVVTSFLVTEKPSKECTTNKTDVDDDLEDFDRLDDGDLALAPFANPTESWLLPDSSTESLA